MGRNLTGSGLLSFMTVTASSGSPRVSPQLYDTLPLSSVRRAEQQDRFPDGGELDTLITFFRSGNDRLDAARLLASNAESIVARAANRIFVGGTPLSFLEEPLSTGEVAATSATPLAADQVAFQDSVRTFTGSESGNTNGNFISRLLQSSDDGDVRVAVPVRPPCAERLEVDQQHAAAALEQIVQRSRLRCALGAVHDLTTGRGREHVADDHGRIPADHVEDARTRRPRRRPHHRWAHDHIERRVERCLDPVVSARPRLGAGLCP